MTINENTSRISLSAYIKSSVSFLFVDLYVFVYNLPLHFSSSSKIFPLDFQDPCIIYWKNEEEMKWLMIVTKNLKKSSCFMKIRKHSMDVTTTKVDIPLGKKIETAHSIYIYFNVYVHIYNEIKLFSHDLPFLNILHKFKI